MKNKINRFNKAHNQRLLDSNYDEDAIEEGVYYDPSYLEVDRIISSTEMFPVIHQKKVIVHLFRPTRSKESGVSPSCLSAPSFSISPKEIFTMEFYLASLLTQFGTIALTTSRLSLTHWISEQF